MNLSNKKISFKVISLLLFMLINCSLLAQTDGISYQAVIIDPNAKEIPGVDVEGNILPNTTIAIRFSIMDATDSEEFSEVQITETDQYGMINLIIGSVNHEDFTRISWDGTPKSLRVEIDFGGAGVEFTDLNSQELTFAPYAYHRNITATGTLRVDDNTNLNGELMVEGPTNLNSSLDVNNNNLTNLTGPLNVDGQTDLNNTLTVVGVTDLMDSLNVNQSPSVFDGNITVEDTATFNGPAMFNAPVDFVEITVNGSSYLNGQVTVNADMDTIGDDMNYNAYPLLVQGSSQGMAIRVKGARSGVNNYISFWDTESGQMWGRIEGQTTSDLLSDPEYIYETSSQSVGVAIQIAETVIAAAEVVQAGVEVAAASTSSTGCAGLGACVTAPIPSLIVGEGAGLVMAIANAVTTGANLALAIADEAAFQTFIHTNIGVTYQSGAGDYAEWVPKANKNETFEPGDLVGIKNGFITKSTSGVEKVMVISTNPIVLGNMQNPGSEDQYEKVAFMGQVPVKVLGDVEPGDYIIPDLFVPGFGKAVHPSDMKIADYKKIVGVAWSVSNKAGLNFVNVAVGINHNDMSDVILKQQEEINSIQAQLNQTNELLSELVPGFKEALAETSCSHDNADSENETIVKHKTNVSNNNIKLRENTEEDIVFIEPSREQLLESIKVAKEAYLESGKTLEESPFWKRMKEEPAYFEEIVQLLRSKFEKAMHVHQSINKKFTK